MIRTRCINCGAHVLKHGVICGTTECVEALQWLCDESCDDRRCDDCFVHNTDHTIDEWFVDDAVAPGIPVRTSITVDYAILNQQINAVARFIHGEPAGVDKQLMEGLFELLVAIQEHRPFAETKEEPDESGEPHDGEDRA